MTVYCTVGGRECPGHDSGRVVCSGMPLGQALGTLVVHEINKLREAEDGCCERCCAPCGVLADLLGTGRLYSVIAEAPPHIIGSAGEIPEEWFRSRWTCQSYPPCADLVEES